MQSTETSVGRNWDCALSCPSSFFKYEWKKKYVKKDPTRGFILHFIWHQPACEPFLDQIPSSRKKSKIKTAKGKKSWKTHAREENSTSLFAYFSWLRACETAAHFLLQQEKTEVEEWRAKTSLPPINGCPFQRLLECLFFSPSLDCWFHTLKLSHHPETWTCMAWILRIRCSATCPTTPSPASSNTPLRTPWRVNRPFQARDDLFRSGRSLEISSFSLPSIPAICFPICPSSVKRITHICTRTMIKYPKFPSKSSNLVSPFSSICRTLLNGQSHSVIVDQIDLQYTPKKRSSPPPPPPLLPPWPIFLSRSLWR